ncbi:MAG: UMP kinase [Sedimentisphaerales bacterium]|nr:UMP kinase [Sedimentisphaerales bacterium]
MAELKYKRMLLKISGEGFCKTGGFGLDGEALTGIAGQINQLRDMGVEPAVVVGAGNLVRGATLSSQANIHRVTADQMGMLATVINALALQDVLEAGGTPTRVMSAIEVAAVCEPFIRRRAIKHLENGRVVVLAAGTGNPFFTTDTCAALRASEVQAEVLIKATKVDGVYSADPVQDASAQLYDRLSYVDVLNMNLRVMDHSAISLCKENDIDVIVCSLLESGTMARVACGEKVGTLITRDSR